MAEQGRWALRPDQPTYYEIRIAGHLGAEWADWFDGVTITQEANGDTLLTGPVDQAALHGLLRKVRNLGLTLLAVNVVADDHEDAQDVTKPASTSSAGVSPN